MTVEIRSPFPEHALPRVWRWMQAFRDRVMDDYSPKTEGEFVDKMLSDMGRLKTWAVYANGELGGFITFDQWTPVLGTCHCVFKKELWGREITKAAIQQVVGEIFSGDTRKIAMCVFADNRAIRALLSRLGAVVEGTYKEHTMRNGKPADMVALALFKERWNASAVDCSGNRGTHVDCGGSPSGPIEDQHADQHQHANVVA